MINITAIKKIISLWNNTPDQPSTFRTKKWVEIIDDSRGTYIINSQIKFKMSLSKSAVCDYCGAYIHF